MNKIIILHIPNFPSFSERRGGADRLKGVSVTGWLGCTTWITSLCSVIQVLGNTERKTAPLRGVRFFIIKKISPPFRKGGVALTD